MKRALYVILVVVLMLLVILRVNPTPPGRRASVLQKSAALGLWPVVAVQLFLGVDPDGPDRTPLIEAIMYGRTKTAGILIAHGADLEREFASGEPNGPPLAWAVRSHRREIAMMLLGADASVNRYGANSTRPTILHLAVESGDIQVLDALISHHADVNATANRGWTPLHLAAELGRADIARHLIRAGARTDAKDERGDTPLKVAVKRRHTEVADLLRDDTGRAHAH